jgi:PAS domain S-box-containing protein
MGHRLIPRISRSAPQSFLAIIALAGLTFVCFRLQLNISTVGFLYLIVIVLLSLSGDYVASVVISVVAALCIAYFFAPPIFSIRVDDPLNIVAIVAFLTTSLVISRLVSEVCTRSDKLRLNDHYLSEGQRVAHMGCWAFDATGFSYWSSQLFRVHGLDPRGKPPTVEEYLALVHPEDRAFVKRTIAKILDDHLAFDFTKRIVQPDGEIRHVRSVGVPVMRGGSVQGFLGTEMDVTEQEQLTGELRRSEKDLRDAIDTIPAIVWSALPDGSNVYVNRRFIEYSGLSAEQTAGSGWQAAIHPDDLERQVGKWIEALATVKPFENEVRFRRADGQYRWHLDRGVPLRDGAGNTIKWYGVVTDIEDRKRAEEALRSSEQRFRLTVDSIPGLVCTTNATGEAQLLNRQVLEYFGKSPEELKSWRTSDAVHAEDLPRVISAWASSIETGHPYDIEHRCRRGDGVYRWFQVRALPVRDAEGRITGWYNLLVDIDGRKRAEEALELMSRDLQESKTRLEEAQRIAHVGQWIWDQVNDGLTWSDETYRIFGLRPQGRPMSVEAFQEMIHPEDREFLFRTTQEARGGGRPRDIEYRIVRPTGEVRIVHSQGAVTKDVPGQPRQMFGIVQDITERKRAEEALQRSRQLEADLAHIDRVSTLGEMAASLAHEIKQPIAAAITSANSCIEWLANEPPNLDRARAAAAKIDKYGNRAAEIIDRIRSLYKKSPPQRELVDVNGIIQEMLALLKGEATRFSIAIQTELAAELPIIMADRVQLQQVFMNLMLNAIEAMSDSGGELTVKSEVQDGQLQFSVSDTGVGLPIDEDGSDLFCVLYHQTAGQRHGIGHQPFHCGIAWRPVVGGCQ